MQTNRTALVIGARGSFGHEACLALRRRGWRVRALVRAREDDADLQGVEYRYGDAMDREQVMKAAEGVSVIIHAANPPGYRDWGKFVLPMLDNSIYAAEHAGARLVVPGNVYNFGLESFPLVSEAAPQHPPTRKGKIRVAMEARLRTAANRGVRSLILRCGDYIGPRSNSSWFSLALVRPGRPVRELKYPGDPALGHSWAYLPDLAGTLAQLLDRESELQTFEEFNFGGYCLTGHEMLRELRRATGNAGIGLSAFPWWLVNLAAPFNTTLREVRKMRYLWQHPLQLDDRKLVGFLGKKPYTPIREALEVTLREMGSL